MTSAQQSAVTLAASYFAILTIAAIVWLAQSIARSLDRRRHRARVVTIGPSLARAFSQSPRPIAREELDIAPGRRAPMGDPLRVRKRSSRSTAQW